MSDITAAITSVRKYASARLTLAAETPMPDDYQDQVLALRSVHVSELAAAGFSTLTDALTAIEAVYPPSCGDCRKCCVDLNPGCPNLNMQDGRCTVGKAALDCMESCENCPDAIERNWPPESD